MPIIVYTMVGRAGLLRFPEGQQLVSMASVGFPEDTSQLPVNLQARETAPRTHKHLDELVFRGTWGKK